MVTNEYPPSAFAALGQPMCSKWAKSEIEWLALAYVQALAAGGDTWRKLSKHEVYNLLTEEQRGDVYGMLSDEYYDRWFKLVQNQLSSSEGALEVRGFWSEHRITRATVNGGAGNAS